MTAFPDPAIESAIRRVYDAVVRGDNDTVLTGCHSDIAKFRGSFDSGYGSGRSGSLGELSNWASNVMDGDRLELTRLRIEVVKEEAERAIAIVRYHALEAHVGTLESNLGDVLTDEWDAEDYVILKKERGEWRLRRMEDRAGHFLALEDQQRTDDPWSGVR